MDEATRRGGRESIAGSSVFRQQIAELRAELGNVQHKLEAINDRLADLGRVARRDAFETGEGLERSCLPGDRELATLRQEELNSRRRIEELQRRLDAESASRRYWERRAVELLSSTSWKLTAPIRRLLDIVRGNRHQPGPPEIVAQSSPPSPSRLTPHQLALAPPRVDVIICVRDQLAVVRPCIESVIRNSTVPMRLIVIDDESGPETRDYLRSLDLPHMTLYRNETNLGYTRSANIGLELGTSEYRLLLNSDTLVTRGWLERLVRCMESIPDAAIVGPVSNNATYQSVPRVRQGERPDSPWAENPPPVELGIWSELIAALSERRYPVLPNLSGLCWMVRAEVLDELGFFDTSFSPEGYGEENEFARRAEEAGFTCRVADDCFVFHHGSRTFGERSQQLMGHAHERYIERYGKQSVLELERRLVHTEELNSLRRRILDLTEGDDRVAILFLMPFLGWSGGVLVVLEIVRCLRMLGMDVGVASPEEVRPLLDPRDEEAVLFYRNERELLGVAAGYEAVVATHHLSVRILEQLLAEGAESVPFYFVQDYEPRFHLPGTDLYQDALESYTRIEGNNLYAISGWLADVINSEHGVAVHKTPGGIDLENYDPCRARIDESGKLRVAAMIRPSTPWRAPRRTIRTLELLAQRMPDDLRFITFGCSGQELSALEPAVQTEHHGLVSPEDVFNLLLNVDVFLDLSDYQAFGRTALEAMAAGCAVVVPSEGGSNEFAKNRDNSLICDMRNEQAALDTILELLESRELRTKLRRAAIKTALERSAVRTALAQYDFIRSRVRGASTATD